MPTKTGAVSPASLDLSERSIGTIGAIGNWHIEGFGLTFSDAVRRQFVGLRSRPFAKSKTTVRLEEPVFGVLKPARCVVVYNQIEYGRRVGRQSHMRIKPLWELLII